MGWGVCPDSSSFHPDFFPSMLFSTQAIVENRIELTLGGVFIDHMASTGIQRAPGV
jgi:hypothetical protein